MKSLFPLSRHDLFVLIAWPLLNALVGYLSLFYLLAVVENTDLKVQFYSVSLKVQLLSVPMYTFSLFFIFWGLSKLCYHQYSATINKKLIYTMVTNIALVIVAIWLASAISPMKLEDPYPRLKMLASFNIVFQVAIYTAVVHSLRLKQQAIELEVSLKRSEIALLRMQTNPHFLFNSLNLISYEIPQRPEFAQELLFELCDLLRGTIALSGKRRVLVKDEVKLIDHYMAIQKARFGSRLNVELEIDERSSELSVPPMLLLPLVENVIKHAVSKSNKSITLKVTTRYSEKHLLMTICNSWPEQIPPKFIPNGGHQNIIDTLKLEYSDASFTIDFSNAMVLATISINHDFSGELDA